MKTISRREFLKTAGLFSLGLASPRILKTKHWVAGKYQPQNVLIVVFDAFSARNISLYGYGRRTTPNIDRLAEKAIVYHNHFAGSNFTTPGTASLLTGTLPWTHRALKHGDTVVDEYIDKSIFKAFPQYHRTAYSHNSLAETLLEQFSDDIEDLTPRSKLFLQNDNLVDLLFSSDADTAGVGWYRTIKSQLEGNSYSLFLSRLYSVYKERRVKDIEGAFPRGLPNVSGDNIYVLEDGINWLQTQIAEAPKPFLAYYHFLPPHFPYKTRQEYYGTFEHDKYRPVEKPESVFSTERAKGKVDKFRLWYDEYILYIDAEFARLYQFMAENGLLENTWLILTSDHGEMFERGITGHQTSAFYRPLLHIPLLIFAPEQTSRIDVFNNTSAIDLLPTLAFLNGQATPEWSEGLVLPPFGPDDAFAFRDIFALRSKHTNKNEPILQASAMLTRGPYKLTYMFGYNKPVGVEDMVELYNLEEDPEELNDLSEVRKDITEQLLGELIKQIEQAN
jgi:arylsulfatase A-like enzyme